MHPRGDRAARSMDSESPHVGAVAALSKNSELQLNCEVMALLSGPRSETAQCNLEIM